MARTLNIAFFGTPERAVIALDELERAGIVPKLIVTQPDRPQGRKLLMTPPPAKAWAEKRGIPVLQPEKLGDPEFQKALRDGDFDAFVVVAYGKILKKDILSIPKRGAINLHASLLPRLRGSSPVETALLNDERHTGVTIMLMDELMDHGPVIAAKEIEPPVWPLPADELARILVTEGAKLLAEVLPRWIDGQIQAREQDHSKATATKMISKADGEMDLSADPYKNFLKWNAHLGWPTSYFFADKGGKRVRVIIKDAAYENGAFVIKRVIPENKREMAWEEYQKWLSA